MINFKNQEKFINNEKYSLENINKFNLEYFNFQRMWIPIEIENGENKDVLIGTHVSQFGFEPTIDILYDKEVKSNKWYFKVINKIINLLKKISIYIPLFQNNLLTLNIKTVYLEYGTTLEYKIENTSSYYYDYNFNIGIIGYIGNSKDLLYPTFYKYDPYFTNNIFQKKSKRSSKKNSKRLSIQCHNKNYP